MPSKSHYKMSTSDICNGYWKRPTRSRTGPFDLEGWHENKFLVYNVQSESTKLFRKKSTLRTYWFAPNTKLMIGSYPSFHQYVRKIKCRQVLFYKPITAVEFFQLLLEFVWDINMIPTVLFLSKDIWRMAISMCKMKSKQSQDVSSVAFSEPLL